MLEPISALVMYYSYGILKLKMKMMIRRIGDERGRSVHEVAGKSRVHFSSDMIGATITQGV